MEMLYRVLWLFFAASFLGWVGETAVAALRERRYVDRSLLFGPVCVIYGVSGLLIVVILWELREGWFSLFLGSAIYATVVEWLAGHALERLTGVRWWDYSKRGWNLDGYICLSASALWGLLGLAAVKWLLPLLMALYGLLPRLVVRAALWGVLAVFLLDCLATALTLSGLGHKLPAIEDLGSRLARLSVRLGTWVLRHTEGRIQRTYPKADFRRKRREEPAVFAAGCGFYKLFWLFFIGAFLGDVTETLFCRVTAGVWMSRSSVVWGPFSLVWGFALALASLLLYRYRDKSDSFLFVAGTLMGGAYEYLCSVFTERVFGVVFWDYSHIPFNLAGRVNLLYCFFWGIAAVVWIKLCYPRLSSLIERVPVKWGRVLTWLACVFMACNMLLSAAALVRCDARVKGVPAQNGVERFLDERYGDARLARIYPAAVRTD